MGIKPVAAAGHSLGEYAACVAAGVFSFKDALRAVAVRGQEMAKVGLDDPGMMMGLSARQSAPLRNGSTILEPVVKPHPISF